MQDDPELYVRRSVANHLGDVLKVPNMHPFASAVGSNERDPLTLGALSVETKVKYARFRLQILWVRAIWVVRFRAKREQLERF